MIYDVYIYTTIYIYSFIFVYVWIICLQYTYYCIVWMYLHLQIITSWMIWNSWSVKLELGGWWLSIKFYAVQKMSEVYDGSKSTTWKQQATCCCHLMKAREGTRQWFNASVHTSPKWLEGPSLVMWGDVGVSILCPGNMLFTPCSVGTVRPKPLNGCMLGDPALKDELQQDGVDTLTALKFW